MEADFLNAAFAKVAALNILPCIYPNVASNPTSAHIRVSVMPTTPQKTRICGAGSKRTWLLQCSVYVRDGAGLVAAAEYIDELLAGIPYLTNISGFTCVSDGEVFPAVGADGWCFIPVQFKFSRVS